ncbi:hypothetical protein A2U01_0069436, partial [Trifolium medium]|nr:hypothetical protein [Trifolium medium]
MLSIAVVAAAIAASRDEFEVAETEQGGAGIYELAGEFLVKLASLRVAVHGRVGFGAALFEENQNGNFKTFWR